jgi:hypothetical protein
MGISYEEAMGLDPAKSGISYEEAVGEPTASEPKPPEVPQVDQGPFGTAGGQAAAFLRGVREGIPFARDVATGVESFRKGVPFAEESARQQAQDEALRKAHAISYGGGEIAGLFAPLPIKGGSSVAKLATGAEEAIAKKLAPYLGETGSRIAGASTTGAGLGAAQQFGEGTDLETRLHNAKVGAIAGGALSGAMPAAAKVLGFSGPTVAEQAAERLHKAIPDVKMMIPASIASEHPITRATSAALSAFPFSKPIMDTGVKRGLAQVEEAAGKIPGITRPGLTKEEAGETAAQSLRDWVNVDSRQDVNRYYDRVKRAINPKITTKLTNTAAAFNRIGAERIAANLDDEVGAAAKIVQNALQNPKGLTYEGLERLKREVGDKLKGVITESSPNRTEMEHLYGALREDVRNSALNAGGARGQAAWDQANAYARDIINQRQRLGKIIGTKGEFDNETVFKKLAGYATSDGNQKLLTEARSSMSPAAWNDVTSGIIEHLGKTRAGEFSPETFVTSVGRMTENNKKAVFGPKGNPIRDAIDDLNTVAQRYKEVGKSRNFSNTALALTSAAGLGNIALQGPMEGITEDAAIGMSTIPLAVLLSRPRAARVIARYFAQPSARTLANVRTAAATELRRAVTPRYSVNFAPVTMQDREQHASGGTVGLSRMEKAVARAQKAIAEETKPLMEIPDAQIAHALEIAKDK